MGLSALVNVPDGYTFDENLNILVPVLYNPLAQSGDGLENAESATFQGETEKPGDKPRKRRKLVSKQVFFEDVNRRLPSFSGAWAQEIEAKDPAHTKYAVQVDTYDDGTEYSKLLAIENPQGVYVHEYRKDLYKVVLMVDPVEPAEGRTDEPVEKADDERWKSNLSRARIAIEEYALCNEWDYFVTLTIDGEKLARSDLEKFRKKLQQMIRDLRRNDGTGIDYLFVPELHPVALKEGKTEWHIHGLAKMPEKYLVPFENKRIYGKDGNKYPPKYVREKLLQGVPISYWKQYNNAFGYSIIEPVRNRDASARYLMKYVSKEQGETAQHLEKGQNLYYHSTGLQRAKKVPPDTLARDRRGLVARGSSGDKFTLSYAKHYQNCIVEWWQKES